MSCDPRRRLTRKTRKPSTYKNMQLSDQNDRQIVAEAALALTSVMELSGRMDPGAAKRVQFSCRRILYGAQSWDVKNDVEQDLSMSIGSDETSGGSIRHFSRASRWAAKSTSSSSAAVTDVILP